MIGPDTPAASGRSPYVRSEAYAERGWEPILRSGIAPRLRGEMPMVDVRDIGEVHARLMRPGRGPHRYICGGVSLRFDAVVDAFEAATGRATFVEYPYLTAYFVPSDWRAT